jgi:hypothetical protein
MTWCLPKWTIITSFLSGLCFTLLATSTTYLKQYNHWTLELVQPLKLLFAVEPIQNLYKSVSFFYVILVQNLRGLTSMASTMESTDTNQMFPFQLGWKFRNVRQGNRIDILSLRCFNIKYIYINIISLIALEVHWCCLFFSLVKVVLHCDHILTFEGWW